MGQFISKMVKTNPVQLTVNEKEQVENEHVDNEHVDNEQVDNEHVENEESENEEAEKEDEVSIVCNNFIHE